MKSGGWGMVIGFSIALMINTCGQIGENIWLQIWSDASNSTRSSTMMRLGVYGTFGCVQSLHNYNYVFILQ